MIENIVNDLNQEFGITPNSVEAQKVLEETQKQVEALQVDEKYKKALLANAEAIKLEQSKISLAVAEKLYADDIRLENLRKKAQMQKENYEKSLNEQAYNAIEQTTPSADANKLVDENFDNKVVAAELMRGLGKNEELKDEKQKAKDNKDILEDVKDESLISKITSGLFGKKATEQETQNDDSFEPSDEKTIKQASKNLSDDENLDDLKENVKSQAIEEPAKIEEKEETVSFNQVLSFIRDKNTIESPFADGTFSNKANQKSLYNNFSKMNIKELRELLSDIRAKNAMLEQQLENLKSGVVSEISKELQANEELKTERKELKKLNPQNNVNTTELINDIQEKVKPQVENVSADNQNISNDNDMTSETRSILSGLANEYNIEMETAEKEAKAENKTPKETINRDSEIDKIKKGFDLDALMASEEQSNSENVEQKSSNSQNKDGGKFSKRYKDSK